MTNQNYIVTFHGEPITRLTFERSGKANISTGDAGDAIKYAREQAQEAARSIGKGAEVGRVFDDTKFNSTKWAITQWFSATDSKSRCSASRLMRSCRSATCVTMNSRSAKWRWLAADRCFAKNAGQLTKGQMKPTPKDIIKVLPNKYKGDYMFH